MDSSWYIEHNNVLSEVIRVSWVLEKPDALHQMHGFCKPFSPDLNPPLWRKQQSGQNHKCSVMPDANK